MPGIQTSNGKAFEYACLLSLQETLAETQLIEVCDTAPLQTARAFYNDMPPETQGELHAAAAAATRVIVRLEPQLEFPNRNIPLYLSIQSDAQGIAGDVRDVLCIRRQNEWEVGLSCKHNHHAVKHSRLSDTIDFGAEWFHIPCSTEYFSKVVPLFTTLRTIRDESKAIDAPVKWSAIANKNEDYYVPILTAFIEELSRLDQAHPEVIPAALIQYLIGRNDFYKVITDDAHQTTRVEAINIAGTLNRPSGAHRSIVNVSRLKLPTQFYHIGFKRGSQTTIEVVCDEGWTVSMRIHNASSRVEPSLKFDVNLISLPSSIHAQVEPW